MGVAKKGRRKITVNGRSFVWFITDRQEVGFYRLPEGRVLLLFLLVHILSEDKKFNVTYALGQENLPEPYLPHLFVLGHEFPGLSKPGKTIATPRWNDSTPSNRFIRQVILWCLDEFKAVIEVDSQGKPLAVS